MILHTIDKQIFAKKIYELTHIDPLIIDMLINLNIIQLIFKDPKSVVISKLSKSVTEYAIYQNAILKEKYQHSLPYIFAGYLKDRTNYKSLHPTLSNEHADCLEAEAEAEAKDYFLQFLTFSSSIDILEITIKINYQKFCKHKINLLTKEEKNSLLKYIDNLITSSGNFDGIGITHNKSVCYYKCCILEIDYEKNKIFTNLECVYKSFDNFIEQALQQYNELVKKNKNDSNIQKIFERAILKYNIDKF